jgi:integrase
MSWIDGFGNMLHDNRHTLVTELAESGAGDEVIMSIAGHVSRAMPSRYSHVRMEAKRRAPDEIAARQLGAEERRKEGSEHPPRSSDPAFGSVH